MRSIVRLLALMFLMLCASSAIEAQTAKAFLHRATTANTAGVYTTMDDPFINDRPDIILIVTPNWNPGGGSRGVYVNSPIAVFYNDTTRRWAILNLDMRIVMPIGAAFNVKAFRPDPPSGAFVHRSTAADIVLNYTFLDIPPAYHEPKALLVTSNWNPGGGTGVYNNHSIGVFIDRVTGSPIGRWRIANQNPAAVMPIGAAFNVAPGGRDHQATRENIRSNYTYLDNWEVANDPDLLLFVTPNPYPTWGPGIYDDHPLGVWYDRGVGKWAIFNQDLAPMPAGVAFTIKTELDANAASDKITFWSTRDGNAEIYVMNADGTRQTRVTTDPAEDVHPVLSPDGSKIAFVRGNTGIADIYVVNTDGSGLLLLTSNRRDRIAMLYSRLSWSPDSRRVTTTAFGPDSPPADPISLWRYGVHVMNVDGSDPRQLTPRSGDASSVPVFSPDGSKIAYELFYPARTSDIMVMNSDGTAQTNLTHSSLAQDHDPAWSPDSRLIAYSSYTGPGSHSEIYVMNVDGTGVRQLTSNPAISSRLPFFSPDGRKIAFLSFRSDIFRDTSADLYVMNADGTGVMLVVADVVVGSPFSTAAGRPTFNLDGTRLAYVSNRDGNHEVYAINVDGTSPVNLTHNPSQDEEPTWHR